MALDEETVESYREAGEIASEIKEWSKSLVKKDANVQEIADKIEERILDSGAKIAFPTNVCLNEITAHYAPRHEDETTIGEDLVTIDIGVHVDGYIADTAYTLDLNGDYSELLDANQKALEAAIELVEPGRSVTDIGKAVKETLNENGFNPIENLTGHEVQSYDLHAGLSIPNVPVPHDWRIKEGMVLAIEPFATDGYGRVVESKHVEIYSLEEEKPTRMREARKLLREVKDREKLPFAKRWFVDEIRPLRMNLVLNKLESRDILKKYPVLREKERGMVSQFEQTMIVTEDGCEITTK